MKHFPKMLEKNRQIRWYWLGGQLVNNKGERLSITTVNILRKYNHAVNRACAEVLV